MRGQTSLPTVGVSLVVLLAATTAVVAVADGQLRASRTESLERADATAVAEALVGARSPLTRRANVLAGDRLETLDGDSLVKRYGLDPANGARIRLGNRVLVERGQVTEGTTVRRIVLVERRTQRTLEPPFRAGPAVTLPRRSPNVTIRMVPGGNRTIERVRANGRVVLADPDGIAGRFTAAVSRHRTTSLRFEGGGSLRRGDVEVTYYPARTRKVVISVTVRSGGSPDG